jgi:hypothetical protein
MKSEEKYYIHRNPLGFFDVVWRQQGTVVYTAITMLEAQNWINNH